LETPPKRGIGSGELNPEKESGNSLSLSPAGDYLLETLKPKTNPQTSGTTVPEPQSGTSRPETHGGFVPQERPQVPPSPRKESPEFIWTKMTEDTRKAYFEQFPEEGRRAYKLETVFAAMTGKPSKAEDFQKLIDSGVNPPAIGHVMDWVVNKSDGHWEFHNSKHFCKDSVYPVKSSTRHG
jgi:hypothetical protein